MVQRTTDHDMQSNNGSQARFKPERRDQLWSYNLVLARLVGGRAFQVLTVTDNYTRECLAIRVDRQITPQDITNQLFTLFIHRAIPSYVRSDTGFGPADWEVCFWLERLGFKTRFIETEIPRQDNAVEAPDDYLEDKPPCGEVFRSLAEAQVRMDNWRQRHNNLLCLNELPGSQSQDKQPTLSGIVSESRSSRKSFSLAGPGRIFLIGLMVMAVALSAVGTGSLAMLRDSETAAATFTAGTWGPQTVAINIEPDGDNSAINPEIDGTIKVAILTGFDFDALSIDVNRVFFGPGRAVPADREIIDADNDGDMDMVMSFRTQDTGIKNGDTQAELTGVTLQNKDFKGVTALRTVP
jgi:predicted ribosomally synthesized peptide with SipW-like signal peptide